MFSLESLILTPRQESPVTGTTPMDVESSPTPFNGLRGGGGEAGAALATCSAMPGWGSGEQHGALGRAGDVERLRGGGKVLPM